MRYASLIVLIVAVQGARVRVAHADPKAIELTTQVLLDRASAHFDKQEYEDTIQSLATALLRPNGTHAQHIQICRLLAFSLITLRRLDEAEATVRGLLALDETFEVATTESPRFRDFFSAVRGRWVSEGKPGRGILWPGDALVRIHHTSPIKTPAKQTFELKGTLEDPSERIRAIRLFYRTGATGSFSETQARFFPGKFEVEIPGEKVSPPLLEYYIQGIDGAGVPILSSGDPLAPLRVFVPSNSIFKSPWFWVPVGAIVVGGAVAATAVLSHNAYAH